MFGRMGVLGLIKSCRLAGFIQTLVAVKGLGFITLSLILRRMLIVAS
jgi:hypothetical protein